MSLGQKLYNLRKKQRLSQEEVAEKLNVTRQTVSKWETDQSTPDFDKIGPLCELYEISADELLTGKSAEKQEKDEHIEQITIEENRKKRAFGIGLSIVLYFVAIAWIMISIPVIKMNPIVASAIFLLICGIATFVVVYSCLVYKVTKTPKEEQENKLIKQIDNVLSLIILVIYLAVSIITMEWAITWIIWVVYAIIMEIIKLIFMLRGTNDEK